jgi:hypothetical protein
VMGHDVLLNTTPNLSMSGAGYKQALAP